MINRSCSLWNDSEGFDKWKPDTLRKENPHEVDEVLHTGLSQSKRKRGKKSHWKNED